MIEPRSIEMNVKLADLELGDPAPKFLEPRDPENDLYEQHRRRFERELAAYQHKA
jgi:hypothetical protein